MPHTDNLIRQEPDYGSWPPTGHPSHLAGAGPGATPASGPQNRVSILLGRLHFLRQMDGEVPVTGCFPVRISWPPLDYREAGPWRGGAARAAPTRWES